MSYLDILEQVSYEMSQPTINDLVFDEYCDDYSYGEYWFSLEVLPSHLRLTYWEFVCDGNF
jgi:hypothetical protein